MTELELLELLYSALRSPFGIVVITADPVFLRQKLYPLRKTDAAFDPLSFVLGPKAKDELWILRKPNV